MREVLLSGLMTGKWILIPGLILGSIIDIRIMKVPTPLIILIAACGWGIRAVNGEFWSFDTLYGLIPGAILLLVSKVSRGNLGNGDALIILAIGTLLDIRQVVGVTFWALWGAGALALFCFVILRRKEMEIPFVPFIFLGYAIQTFMGQGI